MARKTSCTLSYELYDVGAAQDAAYQSEDRQSFVSFPDFNRNPAIPVPKVATLEEYFFWQDGSFELFPDNEAGLKYFYWSRSMSGADGTFSAPPTLTIAFSENHSSVGLEFWFHEPTGDYPSAMTVRWYDGAGSLLSVREVEPDAPVFALDHMARDYRRIELVFRRTARPFRYVKLTRIGFGRGKTFAGDQLISARVLEELHPVSAEVRVGTLQATIYSREGDFSPLNPGGIYAYLQQNQAIRVTERVSGDDIQMGTYYLDRWDDADDNRLGFTAVDLVGRIGQTSYRGGMYENASVPWLVGEIMASAGAEYELSPAYAAARVSGHLPVCTHREALQQVAMAVGAVVDCSRGNRVRLLPPPENPSKSIPKSRKIGGKVRLKPLVTAVDVTAHNYTRGGEQKKLLDQELPPGDHEVVFGEPVHTLAATGAQIVEGGVNRAVLQVSARQTVTLTGFPYIDNQRRVVRGSGAPSTVAANVVEVKNATLVNDANAQAVADRVFDYCLRRYVNEFRLLTDDERVGDHAVTDSLRGESLRGMVESMNTDLTGGFLSDVKLCGVRIETHDGHYTGEFYAGEALGVM